MNPPKKRRDLIPVNVKFPLTRVIIINIIFTASPRSLAGPGTGGRSGQVPQEGNPPSCPGWGFPPAHLCCCEHGSWVSRLPEASRAGENPSMALGSSIESCSKQSPEHTTSTKALTQHSRPHKHTQLQCRHKSAGWGSAPVYKQRGAPVPSLSLGDAIAHC